MRYFIVFYNAKDANGNSVESFTGTISHNSYINYKSFCYDMERERNFKDISLRNIIELNESDYKDFIKE